MGLCSDLSSPWQARVRFHTSTHSIFRFWQQSRLTDADWLSLCWQRSLQAYSLACCRRLQASSSSVREGLEDASRGSTGGKQHAWIRDGLVICEIAFACTLLVGAGLLMRSFVRVLDVKLGFQPERAAAMRIDPSFQHFELCSSRTLS